MHRAIRVRMHIINSVFFIYTTAEYRSVWSVYGRHHLDCCRWHFRGVRGAAADVVTFIISPY